MGSLFLYSNPERERGETCSSIHREKLLLKSRESGSLFFNSQRETCIPIHTQRREACSSIDIEKLVLQSRQRKRETGSLFFNPQKEICTPIYTEREGKSYSNPRGTVGTRHSSFSDREGGNSISNPLRHRGKHRTRPQWVRKREREKERKRTRGNCATA